MSWLDRIVEFVRHLLHPGPQLATANGALAPAWTPPMQATAPSNYVEQQRTLVFHKERLKGTDPRIRAFFDWWDVNGAFPITIPEDGGVRLDEAHQHQLFLDHKSNAASLADTAHGRGGAVDAYPAMVARRSSDGSEYVAAIYMAEPTAGVPEELVRPDLFHALQNAAKAHGLEVGGDWRNLYGFGPEGDAPHIQVPNWRALPFPPPLAVA